MYVKTTECLKSFHTSKGVRQQSVVFYYLLFIIHSKSKRGLGNGNINRRQKSYTLRYADDTTLLASIKKQMAMFHRELSIIQRRGCKLIINNCHLTFVDRESSSSVTEVYPRERFILISHISKDVLTSLATVPFVFLVSSPLYAHPLCGLPRIFLLGGLCMFSELL